MFKLIIIAAAVFCLAGGSADAGPVMAAAQAAAAWFGSLTGIAAIAAKLGASLLLNAAAGALLRKKPRQQDVIIELQQPTSLPPYRFVYGQCYAPGSPAPVETKKDILYGCYILNSRESEGPFTVYFDKRKVEFNGDPYDFSGSGAVATNDLFQDHCQYWIGRGDQLSPPSQILNEAPELFKATDRWRGLTVLWVRLRSGGPEKFMRRWPGGNGGPEVLVWGRWSKVRDPRNPSAPAAWSANQALCVLDALRENPMRPYDDRNLWLETFAWAADVADEPFLVKGGGTIPRFEVNGVLSFSDGSELEDQVIPLVNAGASSPTRTGGRFGIVPATWQEPVMTITDVLADQPMTWNRYRPSSELVTEVSATYSSQDRFGEEAETPKFIIPGAQAEDGGIPVPGRYDLPFVTDHRRAQYVAAVMGRRTRLQRSFTGVLPGSAFNLVAGSTMRLDLPAPYNGRSGNYQVEMIHPGIDPTGAEGVAVRCPVALREHSPSVYGWNPAVHEQDVEEVDFDANLPTTPTPAGVTATFEQGGNSGAVFGGAGGSVGAIRFVIDTTGTGFALGYDWQYNIDGGAWQTGGQVRVTEVGGGASGLLTPVQASATYKIRVRTVDGMGASDWVESNEVTTSSNAATVDAPIPLTVVVSGTTLTPRLRSPNDPAYRGMQIFVSFTSNIADAVALTGVIYGSPNVVVEHAHSVSSGQTRYYFAQSVSSSGDRSAYAGPISGTTA